MKEGSKKWKSLEKKVWETIFLLESFVVCIIGCFFVFKNMFFHVFPFPKKFFWSSSNKSMETPQVLVSSLFLFPNRQCLLGTRYFYHSQPIWVSMWFCSHKDFGGSAVLVILGHSWPHSSRHPSPFGEAYD